MLSSWSLATFFVFPLAYRNSHSCLSSGWRLNSSSLLPLFSAIIRSSRHLHNIQVEASIHLPVVSYFQMPGITCKVYSLSLSSSRGDHTMVFWVFWFSKTLPLEDLPSLYEWLFRGLFIGRREESQSTLLPWILLPDVLPAWHLSHYSPLSKQQSE